MVCIYIRIRIQKFQQSVKIISSGNDKLQHIIDRHNSGPHQYRTLHPFNMCTYIDNDNYVDMIGLVRSIFFHFILFLDLVFLLFHLFSVRMCFYTRTTQCDFSYYLVEVFFVLHIILLRNLPNLRI